ncbi:MAG TPA: alanine--tRNA ligase [Mycobacteriales bacterium]|nr:alanine--tRNA ligase [Mycobacteriales bacterium]
MRTDEIRRRFLTHFEERDHAVVPSASLISPDPTLLLVNAGMVPFKPYFLGEQPAPWPRATSVQKCLRTLDIDEVGKTRRHASFFQMNGNFSFGDYFKETAIPLAWELVTKPLADGGYGLDESRLWITVYTEDDEAADIWHRVVGVPQQQIQRLGMADNFWSMGVPGPCGPCSEINYDRGPEYGREGGPAVDGERYVEIWNLVFMQSIRGEGSGKGNFEILGDLPRRNIDTGMGLERMATLLQGVDNLYEIDQVRPLLERASEITGRRYGADHQDDVRLRIIADHVRSALMVIGDGVTPSNEGRGYVLRRLLRRSVRALRLLGLGEPGLPALLPVARDCMAGSYPEVAGDFERISTYAYAEEQAFLETLRSGTTILDTAVRETKAAGGTQLSGDRAFTLHDTYGFPIDLTLEMAAEQGLTVDEGGFRELMTQQRQRAKADNVAKKTAGADVSVFRDLLDRIGPTVFTGYDELQTEAEVRGLLRGGSPVGGAAAGDPAGDVLQLVTDRTPFYAESGGQSPDEGVLTAPDGTRLEVLDVQRAVKGLVVHTVRVAAGEVRVGQPLLAAVDPEWRLGARQAHSATHVVHAALREVLGPSALQTGSYNTPGRMRLDFGWPSAVAAEQLQLVEDVAARALRADLGVTATYMPLAEAREIGALALFGEKYDETVRVVEIGGAWSRELCGGTHVAHSSQIGQVLITSETSVGAGVRRVEALVGLEAMRRAARDRIVLAGLADALNVPADQVPDRVVALAARVRELERALAAERAQAVLAGAQGLADGAVDVNGLAVVAAAAPDGTGADDLRSLALDVRSRLGEARPAVVVLGAANDGRAALVAVTNGAARERGVKAGALIKGLAPLVGGGGGGRDDVAQGGGGKGAGVADAITAAPGLLAEQPAG